MRVGTLGAADLVGCAPCGVRRRSLGQLPSSESVNAVLRREPGGWGKVVLSTALRAVLISPGVAYAGARGWRLVGASLLSSATITTFLFVFYGMQRT